MVHRIIIRYLIFFSSVSLDLSVSMENAIGNFKNYVIILVLGDEIANTNILLAELKCFLPWNSI